MAYIKTDWTDGMVISEAGLDHLENGVYNNSVAIGDLTDLDTTDKTNLVAAINEAAQSGGGGGGMSNAVKDALLQIAAKVAYIDEDGQEYYDDLYDALYPGATIVSINADYTQSGTVYSTASLDDLRNDLVVNAIYDNGSVVPVISYTLSGTLEEGTSTITVSYGGKTTTFSVTVTAAPTLSSIAAVYTQSGTVYDTDSLDSLKSDLVVTATYTDSSTETVPSADYTLSGTLTVGTSTITVSYESKTTTFNVTVTEYVVPPLYEWDLTQSLTDTKQGLLCDTNGTFTEGTGLSFDANQMYACFGAYELDKTYELTITALNRSDKTSYRRFLITYKASNNSVYGNGLIYSTNKGGVEFYTGSWQTAILQSSDIADLDGTWSVYTGTDGKWKVYKNGTYIGVSTTAIAKNSDHTNMYVGSSGSDSTRVQITSFKIYEGEVIN